jgi:hypothetical protein
MPRKGAKFHARRFSRFVFKAEKTLEEQSDGSTVGGF